jgi:uncharacterized RDD family membrane protein YckC
MHSAIAIFAPRDPEGLMGVPDPVHDSQFYQGVPLRRFVAFCIDLVVIIGLWCVVLILGVLVSILTLGVATPLAVALFSATSFLYRWAMLTQRSATLGMIVTGIEVRGAAGGLIDPVTAFLHVAGFYVSVFFTPLLAIGWIVMAVSPYRRLLHDVVLGTVVINRPA